MRFVVAVIASISLLVQTLLGCSWLHSHDGESGFGTAEMSRAVLHDHDHGSSHDASPHEEHSDHDSGELPGCHCPDCVFLTAGSQRTTDGSPAGFHPAVISSAPFVVNGEVSARGMPGDWFVDHDVGPPTRAHLLYCRLLI